MLKGEKPSEDAARLRCGLYPTRRTRIKRIQLCRTCYNRNRGEFAWRHRDALSTLAGPAHGGAAEDVMKMVHEIGTPENAAAYVKAKRANREAVTGFGHRVYRAEDPRARHMREGVRKLGEEMGAPEWYAILQGVVDAMKPYARHGLNVNVDFYSGVVYQLHGIPMDLSSRFSQSDVCQVGSSSASNS